MSVRDTSIDSRLLRSARSEFLKCGFLKAELKTICDNAGVTTGAVYKRYKSKEDLFCAVVRETVGELEAYTRARSEPDFSQVSDVELYKVWVMNEDYTLGLFQMLWTLREDFLLLLEKSAGTKYENFRHEFADIMTHETYLYYLECRKRGLTDKDITEAEMHVLCTSFWTALYEPFIHHMSWGKIEEHCKMICRFFNWTEALSIK